MSFTYNPDESTNRDKVRGQIGDTIEGAGPRPTTGRSDESNYSNEVIDATITQEQIWQRAVANFFERLASEYAKKATMSATGGGQSTSFQYSNVSDMYRKLAADWRKRYGYVEDDNTVTEGVSVGVLNLGFQQQNT